MQIYESWSSADSLLEETCAAERCAGLVLGGGGGKGGAHLGALAAIESVGMPIDLIVGRAVLTIWPLDRITWLSNDADTFAKVPGT